MTRYIRGYDLIASDADSARTYYHYASDELGSITHVVSGEDILNCYEYDAWGNLTLCEETVENRFKFNGQQYDPISQQYYLRARYYNPVIGRFTQEDTYRGDGLNLYAYCRNNPVYYADPSGHYRNCVKDAYDRIRQENPGMSAQDAYNLALKETGKDRILNDTAQNTEQNRQHGPEISEFDSYRGNSDGDKEYSSFRDLMTPEEAARYDEHWLSVAETISNEALSNQIAYINAGGITKPGGGKYQPSKISATVDLNTGDIYFGYSGVNQYNPSVQDIHPDLQQRINHTRELAQMTEGNIYSERSSFEAWSVDNCAEIHSANNALQNGASLDNIFINTQIFRNGTYSPPCQNCRITFEGVYMPHGE